MINAGLIPWGWPAAPGEMGALGLAGGGGIEAPGEGGDECSHRLILRPFPSVKHLHTIKIQSTVAHTP